MRNQIGARDEQFGESRGREDDRFQGQWTRERRDENERGASVESSYGQRGDYERAQQRDEERFRSWGGDYRNQDLGGRGSYEGDWGRRDQQGWSQSNPYGQRDTQRDVQGSEGGYSGGQRGFGGEGYSGGQRGFGGEGYGGQRGQFRAEQGSWGQRGFNEPGQRPWGDEGQGWSGRSQSDWRSEGRGFGGQERWLQGQSRHEGSLGGYGAGGSSQSRGRPPKGYKRSDERIREDVCDRIAGHAEIDAGEVEVKVQNGEVTLSGTVQERRFKHILESIAESVSGVTDVRNEIRMQRGETQSTSGTSGERGTTAVGIR